MSGDGAYRSEDVADLHERLTNAAESLAALADAHEDGDRHYFRLIGKRQGVLLALDYLRAYRTSENGDYDTAPSEAPS